MNDAVPTREDLAALTIQCGVRQLLARRTRLQKLKEKQDYEALMDRLEKEAFVALVRREQEEAARQRKKEEDERKRKKEERQLQTRFLEAAFDGEAKEVLAVLEEVSERDTKSGVEFDEEGKRRRLLHRLRMVNTADANGNTAVSEAAGGGWPEIITLLVEKGADVNTKGEFGRTPLFRAAFGGRLGAVQTLLQLGADPRIYADDGCTPEQITSHEAVAAVLSSWDLSLTDSMLVRMEAEKQRREEEEQKQKEALTDRLKREVEQLQKEHERCQRELQRAYAELNKRITEHDKCTRKEMGLTRVTLQVVRGAEDVLAKAQIAAQQAAKQLSLAKFALREQCGGGLYFCVVYCAVLERGGVRCLLRDLDEVLIKDVGGKIQRDGRWPLLVDSSGQAATFLRYRDTNYLNALNPEDMRPGKLRGALLGAIRFGKPLVIDMMEVELFDVVGDQLEQVKPGLSKELMSKELLQEERYLGIVHSSDGPQYDRTEFRSDRIEMFCLVLITKQRHPPDNLLTAFYPIEVMLPEAKF
uniref:IQ motif and ankyrin repeat domain-containing protein 1-like n=1 Tax=Centroberyx gerrardi TaxID=166262 RepID=UPI003AAD4062